MKKLLVGPLLIVLGLLVVACGNSPTLLPAGTATATAAASAAAAISSTPPATAAAAVSPTPPAAAAAGSTPPATAAAAVGPTLKPTEAAQGLLLSAGTYVVGTAIPAGTYKGQSLGEDSHYQISTDPDGKNIVAKSPRLTGQFSLQLAKGQYLEVSGVMKITKVK